MSTPSVLLYPAALDDADSLVRAANGASTVLTAAYTAGDATLTVLDNSLLAASGTVTIGTVGLILTYTGKASTTGFTGVARAAAEPNNPADINVANGSTVNAYITARHHGVLADAAIALEAKLGSGASAPSNGTVLKGNGVGSSAWAAISLADITTALTYTPLNKAGDTIADHLGIGTTPALSGALRLESNSRIRARNSGNTTDYTLLQLQASDDRIYVGPASFDPVQPNVFLDRRNTVTKYVAPVNGYDGDTAYIRMVYTGDSVAPTTVGQGNALHVWAHYGDGVSGPTAGNIGAIAAHVLVHAGSVAIATTEVTPLYTDLSMDARLRGWGTDQNVAGPISVQAHLMMGASVFVGNYNVAAIDLGGWGSVITTLPDSGGGQVAPDRVGVPTYPLDAGLAIVGWAGTADKSTLRVGYTKAIQIGGRAGGWMAPGATSYIGTGIDVSDWVDYGLYISGRAVGSTGLSIFDKSGGAWRKQNTFGQYMEIQWNTENVTLSTAGTATDTSGNLLPADAIIWSVSARVTTTILSATSWAVGDASSASRFISANATLVAGTTAVGLNHQKGGVSTDATGPVQSAAAKVRITTVGTPTAGVIRVTVGYISFVAPTS